MPPGSRRAPGSRGACRQRRNGKKRHAGMLGRGSLVFIPGATRLISHVPTPVRAAEATRRRWGAIRAGPARGARKRWRATPGSGRTASSGPILTLGAMGGKWPIPLIIECCVAVRGTTSSRTRAPPSATTSGRASSAATSVSVSPWLLVQHDSSVTGFLFLLLLFAI